MNSAIISLVVSIVLKFIDWGKDMFKSNQERREAEAERERAFEAGKRAALNDELEMFKRIAQADFLGITEAELIGQSEIPAESVRMALLSLSRAHRAFYQNGRWYGRDPVVVGMDRFDPRWA